MLQMETTLLILAEVNNVIYIARFCSFKDLLMTSEGGNMKDTKQ